MKIALKRILFIIIGISILVILMYNISLWNQKINFEKYATDFNPERTKIGLKRISKNWKSEKRTWDNWNELMNENYVFHFYIEIQLWRLYYLWTS